MKQHKAARLAGQCLQAIRALMERSSRRLALARDFRACEIPELVDALCAICGPQLEVGAAFSAELTAKWLQLYAEMDAKDRARARETIRTAPDVWRREVEAAAQRASA